MPSFRCNHLSLLILLLCALILPVQAGTPASSARVIIILDDLGNNRELDQQALALPGPLHFAILPHTPDASLLARQAFQQGNEVLLHAPMANIHGHALGHGGLTPHMSRRELTQTLRDALDSLPHVRGVNNHMGSLLTQMPKQMQWVMQELKQRQLFFLDSRTTHWTVAEQIARQNRLATARRDIFLDNSRVEADIRQQFEQLLVLARQRGVAIGIGHPYPETLRVLQQALPSLALRGFTLQRLSELLLKREPDCPHDTLLAQIMNPDCASPQQLAASDINLLAGDPL